MKYSIVFSLILTVLFSVSNVQANSFQQGELDVSVVCHFSFTDPATNQERLMDLHILTPNGNRNGKQAALLKIFSETQGPFYTLGSMNLNSIGKGIYTSVTQSSRTTIKIGLAASGGSEISFENLENGIWSKVISNPSPSQCGFPQGSEGAHN